MRHCDLTDTAPQLLQEANDRGSGHQIRSLNLKPPERLLDVACGAGQLVIPASRGAVDALAGDIASHLIEQARRRAEAENLNARFDEGDAEALPYPDASFDVVSSLVGTMFAPRPDLVAAELLRVCKPGGRIVLGNWTPSSFIGGMFKVMGRHIPPSALMPSPMLAFGKDGQLLTPEVAGQDQKLPASGLTLSTSGNQEQRRRLGLWSRQGDWISVSPAPRLLQIAATQPMRKPRAGGVMAVKRSTPCPHPQRCTLK